MSQERQFFRTTLKVEECAGKLRLNEVRCVGYCTDDGKEHLTACVGRSITLPTAVKEKRVKKHAA